MEVGCSSGANFALLEEAVGASGEITGVDLSPDMVEQARKRIQKAGWKNISVIEAAAEEVQLDRPYDGLLLFAMQDVLASPGALDNILTYLKPGGTIAAAGPKLPSRFPGKILRPFIRVVFNRFAVTKADQDKPWRLLAERANHLEVEEDGIGISYIAFGKV